MPFPFSEPLFHLCTENRLQPHFMLPSSALHFYMRRCRAPLDQMKAIVGFVLWSLCDAYLLFWWKHWDHLNVFFIWGQCNSKAFAWREAALYHRNSLLNVTVFWNVMLMKYNKPPVSICCKMKSKDTFSLTIGNLSSSHRGERRFAVHSP